MAYAKHPAAWLYDVGDYIMSGPTEVTPVSVGNIRYDALHWGKERGLDQNGGFVIAINPSTGEEIWVQKIYEIVYGDKSPQKYDLFITDLKFLDARNGLQITDQSGRVHHMGLDSRVVTLIIEPVAGTPRPNPEKPPTKKPKSLLQRLFGH